MLMAALALAGPAWGQEGKKKEEAGFVVLLLPLGVLVLMSLQVATMAAFPRFAQRCGAAVRRYRWQTGVSGLAAFLGVFLLAAVVGSAAEGAAGIPLGLGLLCAAIGGVGVTLEAGRWATARMGDREPPHPLVQVIAGSSLIGWAALLVPCAGQVAWLIASCMAMGGFIYALVRGNALDEAPPREPRALAPPPGPPVAAPQPEPPDEVTQAPVRPPADTERETEQRGDYGDQVF